MKIANSGGFLIGLEKAGLLGKCDKMVGVSAGAVLGAYAVSGQLKTVESLFFDNAKRLIRWERGRPKFDLDLLLNLINSAKYRLNTNSFRQAESEMHVAVADKHGNCEFIDAKDPKADLMALLKASMAAPFFYDEAINVEGRYLGDPLMDQMPALQAVERFNPTDVLVLENSSLTIRARPFSKFLNTALSVGRHGVRQSANSFLDKPSYRSDFEKLDSSLKWNFGVLFPPKGAEHLGALEADSGVLRRSAALCERKAAEVFEDA